MALALAAIVIGLAGLVWSSDKFVEGAAAIAENNGLSKLMVGLTVVAFGTSAPEILVSGIASFTGSPTLAIGNAIGSNIANIGLVLGFTATIVALPVHPLAYKQDLPAYLLVVILIGVLLFDGELSRIDGAIMLVALVTLAILLVKYRSKVSDLVLLAELESVNEDHLNQRQAVTAFMIGLGALLLSSRVLVWGAVDIAEMLGVSEIIIGLTIVAIGTSLPELAATLTSAIKGHHDLAIGNILGSNIMNMLIVLPLPGLIAPGLLQDEVLYRDFLTMAFLSFLMALFIFVPRDHHAISRKKGFVLLAIYLSFLGYLVNLSMS